jgi:hypothetical protein
MRYLPAVVAVIVPEFISKKLLPPELKSKDE